MLFVRSWRYRSVGRKTLLALGLTRAYFNKTLQQQRTTVVYAPTTANSTSTVAHAENTGYKSLGAPLRTTQPFTAPRRQPPLDALSAPARVLRTGAAAVHDAPVFHNYTNKVSLKTFSSTFAESFAVRGVLRQYPSHRPVDKIKNDGVEELSTAGNQSCDSTKHDHGPFWALSCYKSLGMLQKQPRERASAAMKVERSNTIEGTALQAYAQLGIKDKKSPCGPLLLTGDDALLQYARM